MAIDLFCGLGGWTEGLLSEGYYVVGFDIERHRYPKVTPLKDSESALKQEGTALQLGKGRPKGAGFNVANEKAYSDALKHGFTEWDEYQGHLVLQDVKTIHGAQFKNAALIVASPPCQEFSYMAMPWKRAKAIAKALRGQGEFPEGYIGSRTIQELTALFDACFRIQREASEAAGHHIPMVVENVKGAQPWVGRAQANFGSFYLWGDVAMVGNRIVLPRARFGADHTRAYRALKFNPDGTAHPVGSWFAIADSKNRGAKGRKVEGMNFHDFEKTGKPGRSFQSAAVEGCKGNGGGWYGNYAEQKASGRGASSRQTSSHSAARKAASAQIAKIPFALSSWIARCYRPRMEATA